VTGDLLERAEEFVLLGSAIAAVEDGSSVLVMTTLPTAAAPALTPCL
jgi:hypothetical protein